ncbi:GntP family permease [Nocardiopsis sp. RSe5-2]|uniref:GntP family permease n=1 Tax=Nocardiopsis endophytica TaxID=3018445 RepID=A0ABT4UFJ1_9ACTN|nr:GntP family permease [Nocardiopsis endophytica]MDA2815120.1 GntP family permease [Nocardiopsis endophytica]
MDDAVTTSPVVAFTGFAAVIALLLFLIAKARWHVFAALLVPIALLAFAPTVDRAAFIAAFETGFGDTVGSIAVVIVLGTLIAEALRASGAVERITRSMIRVVGGRHVPLALTLAGFVVGLAVFSDVAYVILNPLVHVAALEAGTGMAVMATGLVGSIQLTHAIVPPTPGPLAAAAVLEADLGTVIAAGSVATLFGSVMGWVYARIVGPRVDAAPSEEYRGRSGDGRGLPPLGWSYAPILVPLVLIAGRSVADFTLEEGSALHGVASLLGWPVVAMGAGVVVSYVLAWRSGAVEDPEDLRQGWVENALRGSAMIIVVTGLGGALSELLQATPAVDIIAEATLGAGVPTLLLPFVLGVLANLITGSSTVGVITASSLTAPMLGALGLSAEAAVLAAGCGSVVVKHVNASYFWVCTSLSELNLRQALTCYSGVTLVGGTTSMAAVAAMWGAGLI